MDSQAQATATLRRRVLVIDDEAAFCGFMARLIGGLGFDVRTSTRPTPSDFADLEGSDFVFVDMMMPHTDGIQTLDVLSKNEAKASVVLMSGVHGEVLATAETIAKRSGLRVVGMLKKPFRTQDVRRILEKQSPEPSKPPPQPSSNITVEDVLSGLERKEFDAFLQPIVDLSSQKAVSYEALARWRSNKFNLVTPNRFLPLAISHGFLPLLSQQILNKALGYAKRLKDCGMVCKLAVNLGTDDLLDRDFPEKLSKMISDYDLPPHSLTIELTESSATVNEITMLGTLARLKLKQIDLAIDDFGTSYSGLDRLSTIPFNSLKIDMRFVSEMTTHKNAQTIVESSVALAKQLNMKSVAEGIEEERQLELLKRIGCDYGQGFLFGRPMDFDSLVQWNRSRP